VTDTDVREGTSSLATLTEAVNGEALVQGDCAVPYPCGVVGWISYDVADEIEELPRTTIDDRSLPRVQAGVYETIAAWEEPREEGPTTLHVTACPRVGGADEDCRETDDGIDGAEQLGDGTDDGTSEEGIDAIYERGRERALSLARAAVNGDPAVPLPADGDPGTAAERFESDCGRERFRERVRRAKAYIRDSDTFQANLSHRLTAPATVHPVAVFDALRERNPAPYSALIEFPGIDLVSASPELLLERVGERLLTEPIAGTRPRGESDEEDAALEADLRGDAKERAEHAMLVDLERNDLGKVSAYGSVEVSDYRRVDHYLAVMHLVSRVRRRLRDGATLADAIEAVFPGGTITGAPKPRTMEIIDELESTRRGPCTGSIGIFRFDERVTLNILIRTLVRHRGHYSVRVGAGVVYDSDPDREYTETLDKARALTESVEAALEHERDHDRDGDRDCEDGHDSDDDRDCDDRNREGSSDLASEGTP
jgi:anthranilate synthase component 1